MEIVHAEQLSNSHVEMLLQRVGKSDHMKHLVGLEDSEHMKHRQTSHGARAALRQYVVNYFGQLAVLAIKSELIIFKDTYS